VRHAGVLRDLLLQELGRQAIPPRGVGPDGADASRSRRRSSPDRHSSRSHRVRVGDAGLRRLLVVRVQLLVDVPLRRRVDIIEATHRHTAEREALRVVGERLLNRGRRPAAICLAMLARGLERILPARLQDPSLAIVEELRRERRQLIVGVEHGDLVGLLLLAIPDVPDDALGAGEIRGRLLLDRREARAGERRRRDARAR
jgi:hypothetical protein